MSKGAENAPEYPLETGREWTVGFDEECQSVAEAIGVDGPYPGDAYRLADYLHLVIPGPRPPEASEQ